MTVSATSVGALIAFGVIYCIREFDRTEKTKDTTGLVILGVGCYGLMLLLTAATLAVG